MLTCQVAFSLLTLLLAPQLDQLLHLQHLSSQD